MDQLIGAQSAAAANLIKETTTDTFMQDVVEASMDVPVIVDFWAPWCGPCKTLGPLLEKAVKAANGAVRMVKLNIDEHPEIPTQMRVQSIPTVYAFKDGRPIDGFQGAVPDSQVKSFVQRLAGDAGPSPIDEAVEMAKQALAEGDVAAAENIFRQVVQREPARVDALAGLARCALAAGDVEDAREILSHVPAEEAKHADIVSARTALELAEAAAKAAEGKEGGATAGLEARLAADPNDHEARIELANALFATGQRQEAIDHLLASIKADREWNEQAARKQLVKLFEAIGLMDPVTVQARKRLSSLFFS